MCRVFLVENLWQDLRYGMRSLKKKPGFAGLVIVTLALGIGGITAVFSVVQAVLLAPLPYEEPGRLVRFYQQEQEDPSTRAFLTGPHFREIRDRAASFEDVSALDTYHETGLDLIQEGQARRLGVLNVTGDYFRTLRADALRGRGFERDEEVGARLVVISDELWQDHFGSDPSVIGQTLRLSAEPYVVTGIAPPGFADPIVGEVDAWLPLDLAAKTSELEHSLTAVGRLRNGVSIDQARSELAALNQALAERWPNVRTNMLVLESLKEDLVAHSRGALHLLLLATGLVLAVACVNVANLFLVRSADRVREFAIRSALGSGGFRIARQLVVESALVATLGGLLGFALAALAVDVFAALGSGAIPRLANAGFNSAVLGVTVSMTLATAIAFGLILAFRFRRMQPILALGAQSRSATGAQGRNRLRSCLAAAQLSFALMLLAAAAVLTTSFYRLQQVDLGFRVERVLTLDLSLPAVRYDAERRAAFQEELSSRIETIPGVTASGGTSRLPATGTYHSWATRVDTGPLAGTWLIGPNQPQQRTISGDFFRALEMPVLAGRAFDGRDDIEAPLRAVVSAGFARYAFPGMPFEDVIGERIAPIGQQREIIGVVGDTALDAYGAPAPTVYHAHRQFAADRNWALTQVVSAELPRERILPAVRAVVAAMDPELVVYRAAPLDEVVGQGVGRERFALVLMGAFAAVAVMLAGVGLFGVLAYSVRQRTQEIGIRMACGATAATVRNLVLRQAAAVIGVGLVMGLAGALAIGRWLSSLLYETSPRDPRVLLATVVLLTVVALLAAWLPAWRASRVEPKIAIQGD
jgi:putative ABC transport system permease protein